MTVFSVLKMRALINVFGNKECCTQKDGQVTKHDGPFRNKGYTLERTSRNRVFPAFYVFRVIHEYSRNECSNIYFYTALTFLIKIIFAYILRYSAKKFRFLPSGISSFVSRKTAFLLANQTARISVSGKLLHFPGKTVINSFFFFYWET